MATRAIDLLIAYRVVKMLVTPFNKQPAFKLGIIDEKCKVLKKFLSLKTTKEKNAYTMLHRFVFNLKRILSKVGLGGRIGSFATALTLLVKEDKEFYTEHGNNLESTCVKYLKSVDEFKYTQELNEEYFENRVLVPGLYQLKEEVFDGEDFLPAGTPFDVENEVRPTHTAFGIDIYTLETDNKEVLIPGDYLNARY